MLSDSSIRRDGNYSIFRRLLLKLRMKLSVNKRKKLNAIMGEKLQNVSFTIFSNNCLGGVFYHDAGKRFTSPLINTALDGEDFIRFLENPRHYLTHDMEFVSWPGHNYPIARIDDIEVRFVHYRTNEEAEKKFRERAERIDWENLFIIATNHDGLGKPELLERFDKLPYKNKIMYVSQEYPQYDWAVLVPQFKNRFQVRIMTNFASFNGKRYYETAFNLVDWILERSASNPQ